MYAGQKPEDITVMVTRIVRAMSRKGVKTMGIRPFSWGKFGIVPDPPEYDECLGYWDNPDKFSEYGCKTCANYDECFRASEEDNEVTQ